MEVKLSVSAQRLEHSPGVSSVLQQCFPSKHAPALPPHLYHHPQLHEHVHLLQSRDVEAGSECTQLLTLTTAASRHTSSVCITSTLTTEVCTKVPTQASCATTRAISAKACYHSHQQQQHSVPQRSSTPWPLVLTPALTASVDTYPCSTC